MRNIISLAHISLDGFLAGPDGDMGFIAINDELFDHTYPLMKTVDTAVYGRVTYQLMEGYWPTAGDAPDANAHTKSHARWYKDVSKIVASRTLGPSKNEKVHVIADRIVDALAAEKRKPGGDIMIFGSPTLTRTLVAANLVDEWRLTLQPVILGGGLSLFPQLEKRTQLELRSSKTFRTGVIAAHYVTKR
ncbi:MAG TPA: dihydrofolate reductase family protein [Polyangiaceae bacterium]|nr:dihydrofolate reductase family protein [Polyangiaceae bacterium]